MKQLLLLGPNEIQSGIWKGVGAAAVPLWADGNNVAFKRLGFERNAGALYQASLAAAPRDLTQAYVDGDKRIYAGTDVGIQLAALTGGAWNVSTLYTWPTAGLYADLETWGSWLVATNDVNPVVVWKNSGVAAPLSNTTFTRARVLKRKTPFLFAANTSNGDTMIEWCSDSNIEDWVASVSNKAGSMNIRDMDSAILAAEDLGDRVAFYSRSSMIVGSNVGGQAVWGFRRAVRGIGAISRRSVVSVDPFNYGLTEAGIFKTDGNSFVYLDDPSMMRWYRETADFSREALWWGIHDAALKCVTWHFQDFDGKWFSISYYYDQNMFSCGDLQLVAGAPLEVFKYPIVANSDFELGTWPESDEHFGDPVAFNLRSKPLDFGERSRKKYLQLVRVDGQWDPGARLRIRAHEDPEDMGSQIYDAPLGLKNFPDFEAPYFSVEFYGSVNCYVSGIEFFGEVGGLGL